MKSIKESCLAMLAALMVMVAIGTSSAMAQDPTSLCAIDPGKGAHEVCPSGKLISHIHETTLAGAKAKIVGLLTAECDVLFLGDVTTAGLLANGSKLSIVGLHDVGPPLVAAFIYTNCTNNCTVIEENGPARLQYLKIGHELAEVTSEGLIHVVCGTSWDCSYIFDNLVWHALGPLSSSETNGDLTLTNAVLTKETGGFLCPKRTELTIRTTPLTATYITE